MQGLQPEHLLYLKAFENATGFGTHDLTVNLMPRSECAEMIANLNTMETFFIWVIVVLVLLCLYLVFSNPDLNKAIQKR